MRRWAAVVFSCLLQMFKVEGFHSCTSKSRCAACRRYGEDALPAIEKILAEKVPNLDNGDEAVLPIQLQQRGDAISGETSSETPYRPNWTRTSRLWTDTSEDHGFNTTTTLECSPI